MGPQLGPGLASLSLPVGAAVVSSSQATLRGDTLCCPLNIQENSHLAPTVKTGKSLLSPLSLPIRIICWMSPSPQSVLPQHNIIRL